MKLRNTFFLTSLLVLAAVTLFFLLPNRQTQHETLTIRSGDIIFHTSQTSQSKAIRKATGSQYTHCGIIYEENGQFLVFEAIQPVQLTPINDWINRGKNGHYVVKRLKTADKVLNQSTLLKMKEIGENFLGRDYDCAFSWSDDKLYCSELVWKLYYMATGLEVGQLERLGDFDISSDHVQQKMTERYGDQVPLDEVVISPASIFESELLFTVKTVD